jgi:hypothetical protein
MTVLVVAAVGPFMAVAADNSCGGDNPPPALRQKLHRLSSRLPLAIANGGVAGGETWPAGQSVPAALANFRRAFDGEEPLALDWTLDPDNYTVEAVARRVAEQLHTSLGHLLASGDAIGFTALVAGYSSGQRHPDVIRFDVVASGERRVTVIMTGGSGGVVVLPGPPPPTPPQPRNLEETVACARAAVQARIEEYASNPAASLPAEPPIHVLTLTPALAAAC